MSIIDDFKKQSYEEGYADGKRDAVVHGHFEMKWNIHFRQEVPVCSCCRNFVAVNFAYCPLCGAKMDESTMDQVKGVTE